MKKVILCLSIVLLVFSCVFGNGSPEEQQLFFDMLRQQQSYGSSSSATSYNTSTSTSSSSSVGSEIIARDMAALQRLYLYLDKNFLYEIDYDKVYEAMATAMFDALDDKYTYYVTAEASDDYASEISGKYGGLGIYFSKTYVDYQNPEDESTVYCIITQVFPNTPSSKAGLIAGDLITHIDGEPVNDLEATECAKRMKGTAGSKVELTIKRKNTTFSIELVREVITVPTVEYEMVDSNIAYLRILEFSTGTKTASKEALATLENEGMTGLILDLRDNPGGDVEVTLSIADMFISDKILLNVEYKDKTKNKTYKASSGTYVDSKVNVVILINEGTASSAEILSSTMRDNGRAVLLGATSYGKGVMQAISSFGEGYTSVTTASFLPPSGTVIHKEGVKPDIEVPTLVVTEEETEAYLELLKGTALEDFVASNPQYTPENVAAFVSSQKESGVREEVLAVAIRNEYYSNMSAEEKPIADVVYDPQLKAAYEYLTDK